MKTSIFVGSSIKKCMKHCAVYGGKLTSFKREVRVVLLTIEIICSECECFVQTKISFFMHLATYVFFAFDSLPFLRTKRLQNTYRQELFTFYPAKPHERKTEDVIKVPDN